MTTSLMPEPRQRYYTNTGTPAAGCKLYTYAAGTTTPKVTYQDSAGTVPHANPIILDAKGEALIYWSGAYKVDLKTATGAQITGYPADNYVTDAAGSLRSDLAAATGTTLVKGTWFGGVIAYVSDLATSIGSSLIGFIQAGVGAVMRSVQDRLRDTVSVFDFMTAAQIADVRSGAGLLDVTAAVQAALDALSLAGGGVLLAPPGVYRLTSKLTIPYFVYFMGPQWLPDPSNTAGSNKCAVLKIDWGSGQNNHAVEVGGLCGIEGFSFFYPGQVAKTAATPVEFGFSISTPLATAIYDGITIKNINLYNSYRGIRLNNAGRFRVENVQGDPLFLGFTASDCFDVCYMRSVHFWSFYTQGDVLETWVSQNGTAFEFWRVDQLFADDLFGWNYLKCFDCKDGFWGSLSNILCDKAAYPFTASNSATINVSNFTLISNAVGNPAIWIKANTNSVRFSNGLIQNTASVGAQVDDTSIVHFNNMTFANQHSAVVVTSETSDVYINNSKYAVPPFGSYNVRINGERLPNRTTAIALGAPLIAPTAITGGYQFDLSTAGAKQLQWETTYISERNSLYVLEMDWEMVGASSTWYFQFTIQTDSGGAPQVVFAPTYPMMLNGTTPGTPKKVRIPFFINHGRFEQVMNIIVTPTTPIAGASLKLTNIVLYEQGNKYTSDSQVSNMMQAGYNLDAYSMGQTLFAKGKNRIVLTQSEAGIGRATEVPIAGTWDVGDEVRVYSPVAGGYLGYVCTTAGTPGTWKGAGVIAP